LRTLFGGFGSDLGFLLNLVYALGGVIDPDACGRAGFLVG